MGCVPNINTPYNLFGGNTMEIIICDISYNYEKKQIQTIVNFEDPENESIAAHVDVNIDHDGGIIDIEKTTALATEKAYEFLQQILKAR